MRQSIFTLAMLLSLFATANNTNSNVYPTYVSLDLEKMELEDKLFNNQQENFTAANETIPIDSIHVIEVEEDTDIDFDTAKYLPKGFNALDGKNDINWDVIDLVEEEEEVELGFNPKNYLPKGFNPYKGMHCKSKVAVAGIH